MFPFPPTIWSRLIFAYFWFSVDADKYLKNRWNSILLTQSLITQSNLILFFQNKFRDLHFLLKKKKDAPLDLSGRKFLKKKQKLHTTLLILMFDSMFLLEKIRLNTCVIAPPVDWWGMSNRQYTYLMFNFHTEGEWNQNVHTKCGKQIKVFWGM